MTLLHQEDPVLGRALRAVGLARQIGLHYYGHFVGIDGPVPSAGRALLTIPGEPPGVGSPNVSIAALATVADLSCGAAVRSLLSPGELLATVTLSLQHFQQAFWGPIEAHSQATSIRPGLGAATSRIMAGAEQVARLQAWFSVRPQHHGPIGLMPWELGTKPTLQTPALDELTERERTSVMATVAAGQRARLRGSSVSTELLPFAWDSQSSGLASGSLPIGPELGNRVGAIQGGAMYGAAALAAIRALDRPDGALVEGHYQFLRPAFGEQLQARGEVLRLGRAVAYVESSPNFQSQKPVAGAWLITNEPCAGSFGTV